MRLHGWVPMRDEGDGGGAGDGEPKEKMIPYSRFQAVNRELKELKASAASWTDEKKELEKLRGERDGWKTERKSWEDRLSLARAGVVDDEHTADLAAAYGRLADEGKPESAAAYWTELQTKPLEEWPRALRGYHGGGAGAGAGGGDAAGPPSKAQKLPTGGASPTGAAHKDAATRALASANEELRSAKTAEAREAARKKVGEASDALRKILGAEKVPGR